MSQRLAGKLAVVTGATSGIGAALSARLIEAGARVVGVGRSPEKLAAARERLGERFSGACVELSSPAGRRAGLEEISALAPSPDFLVNNAAECVYEAPLSLDAARWRELLEVNLLAAIELTQALAPSLRPGGQIVNLSSVTARFLANPRFGPYALTKAALESFTAALRLELAGRDLRVSLLSPGLVDTPIYDKVEGFEKTRARLQEQVPAWLSPEDIAEAILWVLERPAHVVISEMVLLPKGQAR